MYSTERGSDGAEQKNGLGLTYSSLHNSDDN